MRRNNKALYEQIMRNVSREVKKSLNEAKNTEDKIIPFDKLSRRDYIEDDGDYDHVYCECQIDYYAVFKKPKFRKELLQYIDKQVYDAYMRELENDDQRIGDIILDYYYNGGGYSEFGYEIPQFGDEIPENSDPTFDIYQTLDEMLFDFLVSYEPRFR